MCTLSFLPVKDGYLAAMNRDEQRTRAAALPPSVHHAEELSLLYPQEPTGGTWIGGNSRGNLLALLNWYSMVPGKLGQKTRSRGELIPQILGEKTAPATVRALEQIPLTGVFPFRLFGFFPEECMIREWRWDTASVATIAYEWSRHHWFSSSWSEERAAAERGAACERTWREGMVDPAGWLRELHAGHDPEPGPFSVCVHREDAATVSYTEVLWGREGLEMRYFSGNPCQATKRLERSYLPALQQSSKAR